MIKICKKCNSEYTYYTFDSIQYLFWINNGYCSEECYRQSSDYKNEKNCM